MVASKCNLFSSRLDAIFILYKFTCTNENTSPEEGEYPKYM